MARCLSAVSVRSGLRQPTDSRVIACTRRCALWASLQTNDPDDMARRTLLDFLTFLTVLNFPVSNAVLFAYKIVIFDLEIIN